MGVVRPAGGSTGPWWLEAAVMSVAVLPVRRQVSRLQGPLASVEISGGAAGGGLSSLGAGFFPGPGPGPEEDEPVD